MAYQVQRSARRDSVVRSVEELNQKLDSFYEKFGRQEPRMVEIAREFDNTADWVKVIIDGADTVGTVTAVAGLGVLIAAPFTGGGSVVIAKWANVAVMAGGAVAIIAKVTRLLLESGKANFLERLGKEFMRIARSLIEELKEIKAKVKDLVDVAGDLLLQTFRKVDKILGSIEDVEAFMGNLVQLVLKLQQHSATSKEKEELIKMVVKSGEQCWKIIRSS